MAKSNICDLPEWVPVPTNDSTITIIDFVLGGSNVPFGIFAFLSNLAMIVTVVKTPSLQRPSNIVLCSLVTSDCLVGLVTQPLFVTWWMLIQRVGDSSKLWSSHLWTQFKQLRKEAWRLFVKIIRVFFIYNHLPWLLWSPECFQQANLTVISLDRCYALCRPFSCPAKVTKRGNALSFSRTIFVHCWGKQSKFESSKFIFGSEAERRLIEGYKTKEIARNSGMKKVIVPFVWISTIRHLHDGVGLLLRADSSCFLFQFNLHKENKTLKHSGRSSKMRSSRKWHIWSWPNTIANYRVKWPIAPSVTLYSAI